MSELNLSYPPTRHELAKSLMLTQETFTEDFYSLRAYLDSVAPVRATITITSPPHGFPPDDIRSRWVGKTLPTRTYLDLHEGVAVLAREAIETLRESDPVAFAWWQGYYSGQLPANIDPEGFPECLANINFLIFDLDCGKLELA